MEESCKTCKFYQAHKNGNGADLEVGFCRRYAPRHISGVGTGYEEILWPTVGESYWCGEYEQYLSDAELILRMRAIGALPPSETEELKKRPSSRLPSPHVPPEFGNF